MKAVLATVLTMCERSRQMPAGVDSPDAWLAIDDS